MADHELWLTNDRGERLALLDNFLYFEGTRTTNTIGQCRLYLPTTFDTSLLRIDRMLQLWRAPKGGRLSLWRPFLIQRIRYETRGQEESIMVGGEDCNTLLKRRIVIAAKGWAEADKTGTADNIMKEYVDEAMVNSTYTPGFGSRDYENFTVQRDLSAAPSVSTEGAYENVLSVLQDIVRQSRESGTDLFFDVVPTFVTGSSISFEFRTYTGQIGADLSDSVVFDQASGNFINPFYERDWSDVQSYIFAAGQGASETRLVYEVYDKARLYISKWAWREGYKDGRSAESAAILVDAGTDALERGRAVKEFGGQPIDTEGTQYGRDWNYGDLVQMRYRDIDVTCMVDSVTLMIEEAKETIDAAMRVISFGDTDNVQGGWPVEEPE